MSQQKSPVLKKPLFTRIERLSHDGRGLARPEGKATFIEGALPEESVAYEILKRKADFDEARVLSIQDPSKNRVSPPCAHYGLCGGCSLQHLDPYVQLDEKQALFLDILSRIGHVQPEFIEPPLRATHWHYRSKARLSVRYIEKKQSLYLGFREKHQPRYITPVDHCWVLNRSVSDQLPKLRELMASFENPRAIAQIEVAVGDEVALIFRNLLDLTAADKLKLIEFSQATGFRLFLQPEGIESIYLFYPDDGKNWLFYDLPNYNLRLKFHPTDFTQVNLELNQLMVDRALDLLDLHQDDRVLDLFCGLGNFSLAMARFAQEVTGIEGSAEMVSRATMNARENGLDHAHFYHADLDKADAMTILNSQVYNKLLLDPPRSGALAVVENIAQINPARIVYVSCNPATFARDAAVLVAQSYRLVSVAVMDMFPHTAHLESIALFEKG